MAEAIARRYARALVSLGKDDSVIDQLGTDLDTFLDVMGLGDGMLKAALENPGISVGERKAVLEQVLERTQLHSYTANLLRVLMDNGRFLHLGAVAVAYRDMADELAGRVRATVTTARALDAGGVAEVQSALADMTGKTVLVDFQVDAAILGGVIARVGDTVFDASVRARLAAMEKGLADGTFDAGSLGESAQAR